MSVRFDLSMRDIHVPCRLRQKAMIYIRNPGKYYICIMQIILIRVVRMRIMIPWTDARCCDVPEWRVSKPNNQMHKTSHK